MLHSEEFRDIMCIQLS